MKMKSCSLTIVCVIILVVILFMMFSGSRNNMYGLIEGMDTKNTTSKNKKNVITQAFESMSPMHKVIIPGAPFIANSSDNKKDEKTNEKKDENKENFEVRQPVGFADIVESKSDSWNLSRWVKNALRYSKGMGNENKLDSYKYHTGPPIPLPEGELFFFTNTKFDSECCPATYSNSQGCACLSQPQYNHLMMRGGNNTPPKNTNTAYFNEF
jgi:hypothetical protein